MKVYHRLDEVTGKHLPSAVAIGNFDGVHLGHQALLKEAVTAAKNLGLVPTVLTFYPHPVEVLNPGKKLERLTTTSEKLYLLENAGIESVFVVPFDLELAKLSADSFFEQFLKKGLGAKHISVGFNFRFGFKRAGDVELLKKLAESAGIATKISDPVNFNGQRISSSLVRTCIREGKIEDANSLLGRPYRLTGDVRPGDQRGRTIGFPTANIHCPAEKVLPKNGVYITRAFWQRQSFPAVCNIGVRPTFSEGETTKVIEAHILDFSHTIYDEVVHLDLLKGLREERRFESVDALKAQITKDVALTRAYFA